jgi:enterochelin esterase-like enzyme
VRHVALAICLCLLLMFGTPANSQDQGQFVEFDATTDVGIKTPHIVVWLPPGYDAANRRYGVVYMHDGQNLFFNERSNFNKIWAADKSALRLIAAQKAAPFIIVGIDQPGTDRFRQYMPRKLFDMLPQQQRDGLTDITQGAIVSDAYLRFIVNELKPKIDRSYRTLPDRKHTAIVGSSMGGLISLYAISEYPQIFGLAGCVSTHTPLGDPNKLGMENPQVVAAWQRYAAEQIGKPKGRRIWFDRGTETLDAFYGPYQNALDTALIKGRWQQGSDFLTRVYPGAAHEENAWAGRMDDIFGWLLKDWK